MSVDIFICAVNEKKSIDFLGEGIPDPSFWFGDARYVENTEMIYSKEFALIDNKLADELLKWPGTNWDNKERISAEEFFAENKGKFISIYAG